MVGQISNGAGVSAMSDMDETLVKENRPAFEARKWHTRTREGLRFTAGFLLLLLFSLQRGLAQDRGSISGTVTDFSGAAVPAAAVFVTNTRTNVVRTATTNSVGLYTIGGLIPG